MIDEVKRHGSNRAIPVLVEIRHTSFAITSGKTKIPAGPLKGIVVPTRTSSQKYFEPGPLGTNPSNNSNSFVPEGAETME